MMLNRAACLCVVCSERVEIGDGHFIKIRGKGWAVQHGQCPVVRRAHDTLDTMALAFLQAVRSQARSEDEGALADKAAPACPVNGPTKLPQPPTSGGSGMSERCTYTEKDVRCEAHGVGRASQTASHWLCEMHLSLMNDFATTYAKSGKPEDMKRMIGFTIRAAGGAKAMTERMAPSIEAGARLISALVNHPKDKPPA
jgi:hypothetical protein